MADQLVTVQAAAEQLQVHPTTIRRMILRGELAAVKVGRVWRLDPADLSPERLAQPVMVRLRPYRPRTRSGGSGRFSQLVREINGPRT